LNQAIFSTLGLFVASLAFGSPPDIKDSSPLPEKATYFQQDLRDKHLLEGLYISIVPAAPAGTKLPHTVEEPGNVIHAGVWTGRYLAGVGYQYAVTRDPKVRAHGDELLHGLRKLQEVTGKPGLLARGFVRGHGPVAGWERGGADSIHWHQGQGPYADYRWYGDVSVDNFNAVLYGYAIYYDLAADDAQKRFIAYDVDRLMTHLLEHHCRIEDVTGKVTQWGHVGIDPDPTQDEYYKKINQRYARGNGEYRPSLRASLMLLPDLLIAHHITGKQPYLDFYNRVFERFKDNPDPFAQNRRLFSLERVARVNHSSEGQSYEALYNLIRYEHDEEHLRRYRPWVQDLWEMNWMEGNALFTYVTLALIPSYRAPQQTGIRNIDPEKLNHGVESLRLAQETLEKFPVDRVFHPVMNSLRKDIKLNPSVDRARGKQAATPVPMNERPLDNEYEWKGNPYRLDGWFKPIVTAFQFSCDDSATAWFCDTSGRIFMTRDGGKTWEDRSLGLMGARVQDIAASANRTFVVYAQTDRGVMITRDGGLSWRTVSSGEAPKFPVHNFKEWLSDGKVSLRVNDNAELVRSHDGGKTAESAMLGWRIPQAASVLLTKRGWVASGPGGCYQSDDGLKWTELKLWQEEETGAADFLHAYWMGRYYGFLTGSGK
jgi:photosystem II stability/assembly factor-like uncharacterized protein